MNSIYDNLNSIKKIHKLHTFQVYAALLLGIVAALAVSWALHINGITMTSADPVCGMEEHTHTDDCYEWVLVEDTESGTEATEATEATEVTEATETTESASETEIAEVKEATEATEAAETESTEAVATESTETAVTEATEEVSESTEQSAPPQAGDTKTGSNGETYLYTLVCGLEEHTHTDDCYADESSEESSEEATEETSETAAEEETNTASTVTTIAGVSYMKFMLGSASGGGNTGISVTSLGASQTDPSYYFADGVSLLDASNAQDEDYFIYTVIDDIYYIVDADGNLFACTYLGDASLNSNDTGYFDTGTLSSYTSVGTIYCWIDSEGELVFRCLADETAITIEDYLWELSGTATDTSTGDGSYTLYHPEESVYLGPESAGVAASLSTGESSNDYEIDGTDVDMIILSVTCTESNNGYFWVELYDKGTTYTSSNNSSVTSYAYITTASNNSAWYWPQYGNTNDPYEMTANPGDDIVFGGSNASMSLTAGETYTVTIVRSSGGTSGTASYVISYYDASGNEVLSYTASNTVLTNDVYAHVISQSGSYDISVTYAKTKSDSTANATACSSMTTTSITSTSSTAAAALQESGAYTNTVTLSGDFDVTWYFQNPTTSQTSATNNTSFYVLALSNGESQTIYIYADNSTSADGTDIVSTEITYWNESELGSSSSWSSWRTKMNATSSGSGYTYFVVNIKRVGNTITVERSMYRDQSKTNVSKSPVLMCTFTTVIKDSSFDSKNVAMNLTAINRSYDITGLTSNSNAAYDIVSYESYSAISSSSQSLTLTATSDNGFTAASTTLDSGTVNLNTNGTSVATWTVSSSSRTLYLARARSFTAHFDGTNGSVGYYSLFNNSDGTYVITSYDMDSTGTYIYVDASDVPTTIERTTVRYGYTAAGWYDLYFNLYYNIDDIGDTPVTYTYDEDKHTTVLYADWTGTEYVGYDATDTSSENNPVDTPDTSSFITTYMFDYNDLFDMYSAYLGSSTTLSSSGHSEAWTLADSGTTTVLGDTGLGYIFWLAGGNALLNPADRAVLKLNGNTVNGDNKSVTAGLTTSAATGVDYTYLLNYLFDRSGSYGGYDTTTGDGVYGKNYLGEGNYLFQYDETSGYYYFDSARNAAFYDQSSERFYLYSYLVRMIKNTSGTTSSYSDFLPFNYGSDYVYSTGTDGVKQLVTTGIDYFFGMNTEIEFYLPDDTGTYDNTTSTYGNQSSKGTDMVFKFMGDDDVWVYVDDELVLDLGGTHDAVYGEVDFSEGTVTVIWNTNEVTSGTTYVDASIDDSSIPIAISSNVVSTNNNDGTYTLTYNGVEVGITTKLSTIENGTHTLSFYYLERGASEANAALYTNLSSVTYNLTLSKVDEKTGKSLSGAEFTFYTDEKFTEEADLTNASDETTATFAAGETAYSLREGILYYVLETKAPDGYSAAGKYFTVYLSGGVLTVKVYDSSGTTANETYTYTIADTSQTGSCTFTYSGSSTSSWNYIYDAENKITIYATVSGGTVAYYDIAFSVANTVAYELPATGSMGIFPYRKAGAALVFIAVSGLAIAAVYQYLRMRRLRRNQYHTGRTKDDTKCRSSHERTRGHPRE